MKVTAKLLRSKDACEKQVEIFEEVWPNGAKTTLKNLLRAAELGLDLNWFAEKFLSDKQGFGFSEKRVPVLVEYYEKTKLAREERIEKLNQLWNECCEKGTIPAADEYHEKRIQVWKEYEEKTAPPLKEYKEKVASILFEVLERGEEK